MRIDALRFKNLNSLTGEWSVDLRDPAFSGGLFAITGPTGAGKTTLLDALCLALFGRTPRLKTLSNTTNEIMSRGTGDCFAEATFTTAEGRFRCHWSQRRARRKAEGRLQPPRHEIVDDRDGSVLETKLRLVALRVTRVTGLDFDRFTRSILLAQGGFAAFLQAGPDERAPILEEITGTGIYSEISMGVHERLRRETDALERLRTLMEGLELTDGEGEARLKTEQSDLAERLAASRRQRRELVEGLAWRDRLAGLAAELEALAQQSERLTKREAAAGPDLLRLQRAEAAHPLAPQLDRLRALEEERADNRAAQMALKARSGALAEEIQTARRRLISAEARRETARRDRQQAEAPLKAVRALDVQMTTARRQIDEQQDSCRQRRQRVDEASRAEAAAQRRLTDSKAALDRALAYLETHSSDAALATAMAGIRHRCQAYDGQRMDVEALAARAAAAGQTRSDTRRRAERSAAEAEDLRATVKSLGAALAAEEGRLAETLGEADLATQRRRCDALAEALHRTERALEMAQRREALAERNTRLTNDQGRLAAAAAAASQEEAACRQERALRQQAVADKEEALALHRRVADLEHERRHLKAGEPCPLCGSPDHPWSQPQAMPEAPDETHDALHRARTALAATEARLQDLIRAVSRADSQLEGVAAKLAEVAVERQALDRDLAAIGLGGADSAPPTTADLTRTRKEERAALEAARTRLTTAEDLDAAIQARRSELERVRQALAADEKELQQAHFAAEAAAAEAERLEVDHKALALKVRQAGNQLLAELAAFGIDRLPEAGAAEVLTQLEERWAAYERQQAEAERQRQAGNAQSHAIELERQRRRQASQELSEAQAQLDASVAAHRQLGRERRERFGDKDPDQEEARLAAAGLLAESDRDWAAEKLAAAEQAAAAVAARRQGLSERGGQLAAESTTLEAHFKAALAAAGFEDAADLAAARLTAAEMAVLRDRKTDLETAAADLAARRKDRAQALADTQAKQLTRQSGTELAGQIETLDAERDRLQARRGAISEQLERIAAVRAQHAELMARCERQVAECERWGRLHDLIGSADGKKFRVFAQGLTFEQVLGYANRELQKMSDRYMMVRDRERPLNLLMVDDYQGGVLRATDNLSGGESFLVSLALALGLARMASRKVRLDSLFLDEGFGTLDEEALETALETLGSLRREGKLIGVISHVAALKERIPVQIRVLPGSSGRSRLEGPGCRRGPAN